MKNFALLLLALCFTVAAQAQAPQPKAVPLAKVRIGGGFPVPGRLAGKELTVTTRGLVKVIEYWHPNEFGSGQPMKKKTYDLPKLNMDDLLRLHILAAALRESGLVAPTGPGCTDAPNIEYSAFLDGKKLVIYKIAECRHLPLKEIKLRSTAESIRKMLDKLLKKSERQ